MTDQFIGRRVSLGVGREASRGTPVAPSLWLPHTSVDFDDKTEKVDSEQAVGVIDDSLETHIVSKWGEGSIEGDIRVNALGFLLCSVMGATPTTTNPGSGAYQHIWTRTNTNLHQSLTLTAVDPIGVSQFANANINSFELNAEVGEIVNFTADFMSKTSKGASATASFATDYTFTSNMVCVKVAANLAGLAAASNIGYVKGITLTIEKNVEKSDNLCTYEPDNFFNKQLSVSGEITIDYTDRTYREYMRSNDYKALRITLEDTGTVIVAGYSPKLVIDLPRVDFREWEADRGLDDIVTQKVGFKAFYDLANSDNVIDNITMINTQSSY